MNIVFSHTAMEDQSSKTQNGVKREFFYQPLSLDSTSYIGEPIFLPCLPEAIDVFTQASSKIAKLHDHIVKKQTLEILNRIYICLAYYNQVTDLRNRLPKLHLTIDEDGDACIELNFQSFRFGFTLESEREKSSYYIVAGDLTDGYISSTSDILRDNYRYVVDSIVKLVLENT